MIICRECLKKTDETGCHDVNDAHDVKFCSYCGMPLDVTADEQENETIYISRREKLLAVFSYLGILVIISFFAGRRSEFISFHACQGLALFVSQIIYWAAYVLLTALIFLISYKLAFIAVFLGISGLGFTVFIIYGIVTAVRGSCKKMPVFGDLAE